MAKAGDGALRSDSRRRGKVVAFRVDEAEHAALCDRAAAAGMPLGNFARRMALGGGITQARLDKALTAELAKLVYELRKIGNNVNQLAHETHRTGTMPLPPVLDHAIGAVTVAVAELRALIAHQGEDDDSEGRS